jgi:putative addiction module component (TIGR02574 family)
VVDKQAVWQAVQTWTVEDRIEFVSRVWDQIVDSGWQPELTDELMTELERRWANFQANPGSGLSWEQVVAHVRRPR